ncbi:MAG: HAMP domain-containing histidine kinase [Lachnospiraceae bacterium]|nr:HAMP domain-containing histidine kinase [Lachnospiraceae bacterium]
MIKTLRRKFILITMISVLAVLTILIGTIDVLNYYNVMETIRSEMSLLKSYDGDLTTIRKDGSNNNMEKPKDDSDSTSDSEGGNETLSEGDKLPVMGNGPDGGSESDGGSLQQGIEQGHINMETPFSIRYFTVVIDENGNVDSVNTEDIAAVSEDEAKSITLELYAQDNQNGFYTDYYYDVIEVESSDGGTGTMYIYLNSKEEMSSFRNFRNISLVISFLGLALVFILVLILSKIAIKPVAESYEKQKHFITDASHEIKTPLAIIEANTEVLEMTEGDNEWLKSIRHQIERLSSLTEKLVFLSRMDEENTKLEMQDFSLSKAVREVSESFLPVAKAKGKRLEIDVCENVTFNGNEGSITQAVSLLVDNAMKYSNDGGIISVSMRIVQKNKKEIIVFNTVDEIEVGNHDVLFERFYRSDSSRSTKTGGHGIGLSVVKAIVTAHKGKVTAESKDDKSIEFKITLP